MKNRLSVVFMGLFVFLMVFPLGCEQQEQLPVESFDALDEQLRVAPEFQQLESIRDEVLGRLVQQQVSKEAFQQAYLSGDAEKVREVLGYSREEMQDLTERFNTSIQQLRMNFPEIDRLDESTLKQCNAGGVEAFLTRYDDAITHYQAVENFAGKTQAVDCQWAPYTTCLILAGYGAAATGPGAPLLYAGGAYVCLCGFCEGGWVDWACF